MTKEEIKEAIASTIVENNQKGITATALANLLNEIVDAAGSGGGGGGNFFIISLAFNESEDESYTSLLVSASNEINSQIYNSIKEKLEKGEPYVVSASVDYSPLMGGPSRVELPISLSAYVAEENAVAVELVMGDTEQEAMLLEDGSFVML